MAKLAKTFKMRVVAARRSRAEPDPWVDEMLPMTELHRLLEQCDYVVCALPATPETEDVFGAEEFDAMRPSAVFISIGRGSNVDEAALADALSSRSIHAAAIDVTKEEPLPPASPLWDFGGRVIISHHHANMSRMFGSHSAKLLARQLRRWRDGEPLENVVDTSAGY